MAARVVVTDTARADLERIATWYASIDPDLWRRFAREIDTIVEHLSEFPHLGHARSRDWRSLHLARFPYSVWYLVVDGEEEVRIQRLLHDRRGRDPSVDENS